MRDDREEYKGVVQCQRLVKQAGTTHIVDNTGWGRAQTFESVMKGNQKVVNSILRAVQDEGRIGSYVKKDMPNCW